MDTSDPFEIPRRSNETASPQAGSEAGRPGGDGPPQVGLDAAATAQVSPAEVGSPRLLSDLVLEEAVLDSRGVTCHLKDRDWAHPSCSSCPERGDVARADLCRLGLAQEKALVGGLVGG